MAAILRCESAEVGLEQILAERDLRSAIASRWQKEDAVFLSFGLNLAGPRKRSRLADRFFLLRLGKLRTRLLSRGACLRAELIRQNACGVFWLASVEALAASDIKKICMDEEERGEAGRLLDLDVRDASGRKLERQDFGRKPRRCLLCPEEAFACARSRRHSVQELLNRADMLMREELLQEENLRLSGIAAKAALMEALAGPKPGLVDRFDPGSHRDMDIFSFAETSLLLQRFAEACGKEAVRHLLAGKGLEYELLEKLAALGKEAEQHAFATVGANTQNGLIFAFALLLPSLLSLADEQLRAPSESASAYVSSSCGELNWRQPPKESSFSRHKEKRGLMEAGSWPQYAAKALSQRVQGFYQPFFVRDQRAGFPLEGARNSAKNGYYNIMTSGLEYFRKKFRTPLHLEEAALMTLLFLLPQQVDRNLLRRGGTARMQAIQKRSETCRQSLEAAWLELVSEAGVCHQGEPLEADAELRAKVFSERLREAIRDLTPLYEKDCLSPGGCADLLALCLFFFFLCLE